MNLQYATSSECLLCLFLHLDKEIKLPSHPLIIKKCLYEKVSIIWILFYFLALTSTLPKETFQSLKKYIQAFLKVTKCP